MMGFIQKLKDAPPGMDDYVDYLRGVVAEHAEEEEPAALFRHIFQFMEEHSSADLGTPGPLVHLVERYYPMYVDELRQSLKRKPTGLTVWMVNRILNAKTMENVRKALMGDLAEVKAHPLATSEVRAEADRFLKLQKEKDCQQSTVPLPSEGPR